MKHRSDPKILNERTLERDHRRLDELLEPGMRVLDAGCGTGSITAGIARRVGASGFVVGIDRDASLLEQVPVAANLRFERAEIREYRVVELFDVVSVARVLQWIAPPGPALDALTACARPGGLVVVLDYNHAAHVWDPECRPEFRRFYEAFLAWRAANGWSNQIADDLPALFQAARLVKIESRDETESDFDRIPQMWTHMVDSLGPALIDGGFLSEAERVAAREANEAWRKQEGRSTRLVLRAVTGRVPG